MHKRKADLAANHAQMISEHLKKAREVIDSILKPETKPAQTISAEKEAPA